MSSREGPRPDWLLHASAAFQGALDAGAYECADHLLAAIEVACEQGGSREAAERALADAYLLLDRAGAPAFNRPA